MLGVGGKPEECWLCFEVTAAGRGGWVHPYKRDPEQVRRDVACGLLTIAQARDLYGVVLTGWPPRVDVAATQRLRANPPARNEWIDRGVPQATPGPNTFWELAEPPTPWPGTPLGSDRSGREPGYTAR